MDWESVERKTEILLEMTLRGHHPNVDKMSMITTTLGGVRRFMSCKKPDAARTLRRMKTETNMEMVASNEARRRIKLGTMKEMRVKMGIKKKHGEKKRMEQQEAERRDAQM